jgi:hypothetical protein
MVAMTPEIAEAVQPLEGALVWHSQRGRSDNAELAALAYCMDYAADPGAAQQTVRDIADEYVENFQVALTRAALPDPPEDIWAEVPNEKTFRYALHLRGTFDPETGRQALNDLLEQAREHEAGQEALNLARDYRLLYLPECLLDAGDPTLLRQYVDEPAFGRLHRYHRLGLTHRMHQTLVDLEGPDSPSVDALVQQLRTDGLEPYFPFDKEDAQLLGRLRPDDVAKVYAASPGNESRHILLAIAGLEALRIPEAERAKGHTRLIKLLEQQLQHDIPTAGAVFSRLASDDPLDGAQLRQDLLERLEETDDAPISWSHAASILIQSTDDPKELVRLGNAGFFARENHGTAEFIEKLAAWGLVGEARELIDQRYPRNKKFGKKAAKGYHQHQRLIHLRTLYEKSGDLEVLDDARQELAAYLKQPHTSSARYLTDLYVASQRHGHDLPQLKGSLRKTIDTGLSERHQAQDRQRLVDQLLDAKLYEHAAQEITDFPNGTYTENNMQRLHVLLCTAGLAEQGHIGAAAEMAGRLDTEGTPAWWAIEALRAVVSGRQDLLQPSDKEARLNRLSMLGDQWVKKAGEQMTLYTFVEDHFSSG